MKSTAKKIKTKMLQFLLRR